ALTSLSVPDTSGLTSAGTDFMNSYARSCTALTSLSVPNTSGLTSAGTNFMASYADSCSSLTSLLLPDTTGWFGTNNVDWSVPAGRLGVLKGYVKDAAGVSAWQGLTVSGKKLYTNYIRSVSNVMPTIGFRILIGTKWEIVPVRRLIDSTWVDVTAKPKT
ncbi:MAG TPA: hypothetical protein PKD68_05220, partial [Candidatus Saccharibacteria bacterium]|nr:hypothetical protein [Candidatus Saccharibacteria bacterium]